MSPIRRQLLPRSPRAHRCRNSARRGIAAIETAVFIPVIAFITFGSIELSNLIFMRQSLTMASYEAARATTKPGGSEGLGTTRAGEVMAARGVTNFSVTYTPQVTNSTPRGTMIRVTVSTPTTSLSYAPFRLFAGSTISSSVSMVHQ